MNMLNQMCLSDHYQELQSRVTNHTQNLLMLWRMIGHRHPLHHQYTECESEFDVESSVRKITIDEGKARVVSIRQGEGSVWIVDLDNGRSTDFNGLLLTERIEIIEAIESGDFSFLPAF